MQSHSLFTEWITSGTLISYDHEHLLVGWGKRQWLIEPNPSKPCFYFPDYFLEDKAPWFEHEYTQVLPIKQLLSFLDKALIFKKTYAWQNPNQSFFSEAFVDLKRKIADKKLIKAVPYAMEVVNGKMTSEQLRTSLKNALNYALEFPVHIYGFWDENEGMLGVTPEKLFCYNSQGIIETMACAGTKRIDQANASFLSDAKERFEHQLVVQGITESLSPYGKVTIGDLETLKLSQLTHLVTPIQVKLHADFLFKDMVKALHPTPALGAFPKNEGQSWLKDYQKHINRLRFGAPVGYLHSECKDSMCLVAIRNVQWNQSQMLIAAGCGVVADSQQEKEWAEINLKLNAIKEMLAL